MNTKKIGAAVLAAAALCASAGERNAEYEKLIAAAADETAAYRALTEKGGETVSSDPIAAGRALEKPNLVYPVLYRPGKTLTGRLADWDAVPFEGVVRARMGGSSDKAPADLLPKFKACVSDTSLFILLTAKDAHLAFARNRECLYRNDCFEVYLDPLFTHAFAMGELVSQTFVTPADTNATEIIASGKLPWKTRSVAFAGGWAAELELPLDNPYFSVKPFDGLRFGVNVSYCNNDHPTRSTVTCKTGWSSLDIGDNSYQTPGVYGVWTVVMDRPAPVRAATEGPIIAANNVRRREGGTLEDPELLARHRPSPPVTRGFNADASERNCADCRAWGGDNLRANMLPFPVMYFKKFKTTEGYTECAATNLIQMCRNARRHGVKLIVGCGGLPHRKGSVWLDNADETIAYWTNVIARVQGEKDAIWGFDLVNEPLDFKQLPMAPIEFRPFFCKAVKAIREVDRTSWLIYETGPGGEWDGFENLLPLPDPRIVYSCHFYKPGSFTHQGVDGSLLQDPHLTPKAQAGTSLTYPGYFFGRWFDRAEMERQLEPVIAFQRKWNVPIYLGEFSCASWGPKGSTAQYLSDCTSVFEKYGWSWSYHNLNGWQGWNLDSADGVYTNLGKIPKDPNTLRAQVMRGYFAKTMPMRGLCAHRGDSKCFPENTVPAFESAVRKGAEMVEFDVWRCKTGELVVLHDATVDRTTDGHGRVSELTFDEIKALDAGGRKAPLFKGVRIPTFDEAIDALPKQGVWANVHCKDPDVAAEVARRLREKGRLDSAFIAAELGAIAAARAAEPRVRACNMSRPVGWGKPWTGEDARKYAQATADARCDFLQLVAPCAKEDLAELRRFGSFANYFFCDDPGKLAEAVGTGADFILTNDLDAMRPAWERLFAYPQAAPVDDILVNRPDYFVYRPSRPRGVPQTDRTKPSDTYNDHFHVFWDDARKLFYAFWTQAGVEADPSQHICFAKSFDRGRTWTEPVILAGSPCAARPGLVASWQQVMISRKGRIYCLWNQQTTSAGPHCGDMFGFYSDDAGETWSAPKKVALPRCDLDSKDVTVPPSWCNWQPPQRFLPGGRFLVGASRHGQAPYDERGGCKVEFWEFANIDENPEVDRIKVIAHGTNRDMLHIDESAPGAFKAKYGPAVEEAAIVKLPDGRLFAVMRSSIGHPLWSQSRDDGKTWSPVQVLKDAEGKPFLHCRSPLPFFDWKGNEAGSGTYFALIHNTFDFNDSNAYQNRGPLYLIAGRFDPDGEQPVRFSAPKLFAPRPSGNSFYASYTCVDGEGVLWFNDCKFYLLGRIIGPEWFE